MSNEIEDRNVSGFAGGIELREDEYVVFETKTALLTNERLFVENRRLKRKSKKNESESFWLESDISATLPPTSKNGGKTSRKSVGIKLLAFGIVLVVLQVIPYTLFEINIIQNLGTLVESVYFLSSMLGVTIGLYLYVGSFINLDPHTSLLFSIPTEDRDLVAIFDGWDSSDAEKLGREFRKIRRSIIT